MRKKNYLSGGALVLVGILIACLFGEAVIRIGTLNQENYVVEMWRYAKLLKCPSQNPEVLHEHIPNSKARLQNVDVSINSLGLRGPEPKTGAPHRVAIVGDSMAFGWGVAENDCLRGRLEGLLPPDVDVVNAGVGNMNLNQAVSHWLDINKRLDADLLVVAVTQRAVNPPREERPGFLVRHSELAALALTFLGQISSGEHGERALVDGYKKQWSDEEGDRILHVAFDKLRELHQRKHVGILVVNIPETHDLNNYRFDFITRKIRGMADEYGFPFVDVTP